LHEELAGGGNTNRPGGRGTETEEIKGAPTGAGAKDTVGSQKMGTKMNQGGQKLKRLLRTNVTTPHEYKGRVWDRPRHGQQRTTIGKIRGGIHRDPEPREDAWSEP